MVEAVREKRLVPILTKTPSRALEFREGFYFESVPSHDYRATRFISLTVAYNFDRPAGSALVSEPDPAGSASIHPRKPA